MPVSFSLFFCVCKKTGFYGPKTLFKPFLVGQNFHICLWSGQRGLPPSPPLLTVSLTVKYPVFFDDSPNNSINIKYALLPSCYFLFYSVLKLGDFTQDWIQLAIWRKKCWLGDLGCGKNFWNEAKFRIDKKWVRRGHCRYIDLSSHEEDTKIWGKY